MFDFVCCELTVPKISMDELTFLNEANYNSFSKNILD